LFSSMVMTPSEVTFSIASAIRRPISGSPAEMVPTRAISLLSLTFWLWALMVSTALATALLMPRRISMGLAPAVTFFMPSVTMACARTVAVVVPSPAASLVLVATSRTSCAPMFSNSSFSSISLAMVTPSLVMTGAPNFLPSTTLRPLGPRVIFTVFARVSIPAHSALRASSPCLICFAIIKSLLQSSNFNFRGETYSTMARISP
jgi:hypothetical protein